MRTVVAGRRVAVGKEVAAAGDSIPPVEPVAAEPRTEPAEPLVVGVAILVVAACIGPYRVDRESSESDRAIMYILSTCIASC